MSDEKKVLSQNDITMIKVYYYLKDNPDKINLDLPKYITRPDVKDNSKKVYSVSSDNWKYLKGINKDGKESKVGAVLGFEQENNSIKLKICGAKSRAEISKRRIDKILKDIDEENYELTDIHLNSRIITIDEQKDFLKQLDIELDEYIKNNPTNANNKKSTSKPNTVINIGNSRNVLDNSIHIKQGNKNSSNKVTIEDIANSLNKKIKIKNIKSKIEYLSEKSKEKNISGDKKEKIIEEIEKYNDELNELTKENDEIENEIKEKYESDDKSEEYENLVHIMDMNDAIIEKYTERIIQLEEEINDLNLKINSFDEAEKQIPEGVEKLNQLINEKEKLLKKKIEFNSAKKICIKEKNKYKEILKLKSNIKPEIQSKNDLNRSIPNNNENSNMNRTTPNIHNSSQQEKQYNKDSDRRILVMYLTYYDLNAFDRYRAKLEAYKKVNSKEPNLFRKMFLFFPSFKYSGVANDYIGNGNLKLDNIIRKSSNYKNKVFVKEVSENINNFRSIPESHNNLEIGNSSTQRENSIEDVREDDGVEER